MHSPSTTIPTSRRRPGPTRQLNGFTGDTYLDINGSRPSPTGANIRAPHPPRIPFSHARAWEKGKRGEGGTLNLAPMGLRRDDGFGGSRSQEVASKDT